MTTVFATREPLQTLTMATTQRSLGTSTGAGRRHSARLMEKEDMTPLPLPTTNGYHKGNATGAAAGGVKRRQGGEGKGAVGKKRKAEYDEEADGFQFTRTKSRRTTRKSGATVEAPPPPAASSKKEETLRSTKSSTGTTATEANGVTGNEESKKKGKRKQMSFSTPNGDVEKEEKPKRRSKRISNEGDPESTAEVEATASAHERLLSVAKRPRVLPRDLDKETAPDLVTENPAPHGETATKIALPFADTPVIRRNKEMRQGKAGKGGERRSSLGMRGRRASSLIESGNSNALPHTEVESQEFYKHIESEGLSEPRRMRQLLTWCATRAMGDKPSGTNSGNASEILAARVIQEELLKDFSNKSEMSDWFSREDTLPPAISVIKKPNPKNVQNAAKIQELEEQIKQLQTSLTSLKSLHNKPPIPSFPPPNDTLPSSIDPSLLDDSQQSLLQTLITPPESSLPTSISHRLNTITSSLEPTIDRFADGTHRLSIFRDMADKVAGRVLGAVAEGLERRSGEGEEKEDVRNVLRALSRVDR